jgi:hypothetical protein
MGSLLVLFLITAKLRYLMWTGMHCRRRVNYYYYYYYMWASDACNKFYENPPQKKTSPRMVPKPLMRLK